jgi:hypothetical protein
MPEFWGRYLFQIFEDPEKKRVKVFGLSKPEVEFIFRRSEGKCRILLIANFGGSQFKQGLNTGLSNATTSAGVAKNLGAPNSAFVYADIEPNFVCNPSWFPGWWKGMEQAGRGRGGLYEDPLQTGSVRNAQNKVDMLFVPAYRKALQADAGNISTPVFPPDQPSRARLLWSIRPSVMSGKIVSPSDRLTDFKPMELDFHRGMTVLWQYAGDCFVVSKSNDHKIDMNLANDRGLASMWKG